MPVTLPYPPLDIANRVGSLDSAEDPYRYYDEIGRRTRQDILSSLPADWALEGKRVLDFGCGAGRTLRHFVPDAGTARFWGCDIDGKSVEWLRANLPESFTAFQNAETPPLESGDAAFDLVYCISVFTHLTDTWSAWLLELHRVLAPGGLLMATFMGEGMSQTIAGEPWDEDRVGMLALRPGQSWDLGGPMVLHSPWWLREHWGRLFEVLSIRESGFCHQPGEGHGVIVLRKDDRRPPSREELERPASDEPREAIALAHHAAHLAQECQDLRWAVGEAQRARQIVEGSRSYQLTRPLRRVGAVARRFAR